MVYGGVNVLNTISKNGYYLMIINSFASGTLGLLLSFVYCKWCSDNTCSGPCFQFFGARGGIAGSYRVPVLYWNMPEKETKKEFNILGCRIIYKNEYFVFFFLKTYLFICKRYREKETVSLHSLVYFPGDQSLSDLWFGWLGSIRLDYLLPFPGC